MEAILRCSVHGVFHPGIALTERLLFALNLWLLPVEALITVAQANRVVDEVVEGGVTRRVTVMNCKATALIPHVCWIIVQGETLKVRVHHQLQDIFARPKVTRDTPHPYEGRSVTENYRFVAMDEVDEMSNRRPTVSVAEHGHEAGTVQSAVEEGVFAKTLA